MYLPLSLFITLAGSRISSANVFKAADDNNLDLLGAARSNLYKVQLYQDGKDSSSITYMSTNGVESEKRKRSVKNVIKFGSRATINLLRGKDRLAMYLLLRDADEVKKVDGIKYFKKSGGWKRALADFDSMKPTNREYYFHRDGSYILEGQTGDRTLYLSSIGANKTPRLQVFNKVSDHDRNVLHILDYDK